MMNTFPIRNTLLICALVGFSVFMSGLHRVPIPTVDGAIRAVEARFIIQTGQWFPIQNFEGVITDHPPLYIWLSALSMKIFGVTDFAVNFSQHFCGMLVVLLTGLIALEIGLGSFGAVVSVFILCLTRDFILSSVRGYIEPILELFSYLAVWHSIRAMKRDFHLHSILSGIFVFLAIFSKGPPAFWVFIFLSAYILVKNPKQIFYFLTGFLIMVLIFIFWTSVGGHWDVWKKYWFEQILSSALRGRDGAQGFEPFYFTSILVQYYIPWLPFLIYAIYKCVKNIKKLHQPKNWSEEFWIFIFGFGFFAGFSLVKWKFWYYIAPAYPAFAIVIAGSLLPLNKKWDLESNFRKFLIGTSLLWIFIANYFPIPLHLERAQEVMDFKENILQSDLPDGPIWYIHCLRDHNILGTSGRWYFKRDVIKVSDAEEENWAKEKLKSNSFVMMDKAHFNFCREGAAPEYMKSWCSRLKLIQTSGTVALTVYE